MADAAASDERWALRILCLDFEFLGQHCGNEGPDLENQFRTILRMARDRQPVADLVRDLLGKIDGSESRGPSIPGRPVTPTGVTVYVCPLEVCDRLGGRLRPGAPQCNVHDLPLKRVRLS